ncbi:MAG: acetate--CoA ligase family protein [Thermoanaerobaculum sp.]
MRPELAKLFNPRSVALVGVSSRPESLSGRLLANLQRASYTGAIYPVNPKAKELAGLPCFPSLAAVPELPDVSIIMVPRDAALAAVEESLQRGVKAVVLITAGFREGGEEGARLERAIVERVRQAGAVMLGPNCMGVVNTDPAVRLDATFSPVPPRPGGVAFASHSGALGVAMFEQALEVGLGISLFVSLGNSAVVTTADALEVFAEDPRTRAVMLYLEAIEEPRRFLEVAKALAAQKPVVVLKAGRTEAGQKAAGSHTGALAAQDRAVDALLAQAGCVRVQTLRELLDFARTLERVDAPKGPRVAVVSNAGGPAIAACDALATAGLELATLAPSTQEALRAFLPPEAAVGNPVDMLPSARPQDFREALRLVSRDSGVDAVVTITVTPPLASPMDVARALAEAGVQKPFIPVFMTSPEFYPGALEVRGLPPIFRFPEDAVGALACQLRVREAAARLSSPPVVPFRSASVPERSGFLPPEEAMALVEEAGIPVAPWAVARSLEELEAAAAAVGFPLVLKAFGARIVHKTELSAVVLDIRTADQLQREARAMAARLEAAGQAPEGFLLQRFLPGGRELILGATRDPVVGPLVLCGLGGVAVEVWRDVSMRPAPCSPEDARAMVEELKGKSLLGPFRGQPPVDREALVAAIVRLSALAAGVPELAECDINPLLAFPHGVVAVDVRIRLERG